MRWVGLSEAQRAALRTADGVDRETKRVTGKNAEAIFRLSQTYVPVETGALRASGSIHRREGKRSVAYTIKYGDRENARVYRYKRNHPARGIKRGKVIRIPTNTYSYYVHELHNKHKPPTRRKFLADAVTELAEDCFARWREYVGRRMTDEWVK